MHDLVCDLVCDLICDLVCCTGKRVGTFFSLESPDGPSAETQAHMARLGGRALAALPSDKRLVNMLP